MCFGLGSSHQPQCPGRSGRRDGRYFCGTWLPREPASPTCSPRSALLLPLEWRPPLQDCSASLTPPTRCSGAWGPHPSRTSDRSCPWCCRQTRPPNSLPSSPRPSTRTSLKARLTPFWIHLCSPAQHVIHMSNHGHLQLPVKVDARVSILILKPIAVKVLHSASSQT